MTRLQQTALAATAWQDDAACRDTTGYADPFPQRGHIGVDQKRLCASCPVRLPCLESALSTGREDTGIWGGHGGAIRRHLRRLWVRVAQSPGGFDGLVAMLALVAAIEVEGERLQVEVLGGRAPAEGRPNRNGPNARHGVYATYVKGCDCRLCCIARDFHTVELSYRRLEQERAA